PPVTVEAMDALCAHHWPGNVRELENVLERALVLSRGEPISERLLSNELVPSVALPPAPADRSAPPVPGATFAEIERHAIMSTYEACGRSPQKTAQVLGLSPRTIHYRLREYGGKQGRRLPRDCTPCAPSLQTVR
ncbi:MAG TPA: helix-turn-helix domain-containing protein, partial [Polyangia bacterium]|nr:helix-turn-helix domain-containing protein [Polyangia bacterium]